MSRPQADEWAGGAVYYPSGFQRRAHPRVARTIRMDPDDGEQLQLWRQKDARGSEVAIVSNESATEPLEVTCAVGNVVVTIGPGEVAMIHSDGVGWWVYEGPYTRIYP